MLTDREIDILLEAYCDGLYAMDPRTTYPFWDYDFAPLFSREWIAKMLAATRAAVERGLQLSDYRNLFAGPSVPRKELLYSLIDMKVARIGRQDRMRLVEFWGDILKYFCGEDWLSRGANRSPVFDDVDGILASGDWLQGGPRSGRAIGAVTTALHALAYSLYSDVFVHQCAECRGPYDVSQFIRGQPSKMLIRSWEGLRPRDVWNNFYGTDFDSLKIAAVYDGLYFHVDVYNHVSWHGNAPGHLKAYCLWIDGTAQKLDSSGLTELAGSIADLADSQFRLYRSTGVEEQKQLWIRQRNYQFRHFFAQVGLSWRDREMGEIVRGRPLLHEPFWDMTLPKQPLYRFLKKCLDPREDIFYQEWRALFFNEFGKL